MFGTRARRTRSSALARRSPPRPGQRAWFGNPRAHQKAFQPVDGSRGQKTVRLRSGRGRLKAGDHFYVAPGQVHQATNHGSTKAKLSVVFLAEKGSL